MNMYEVIETPCYPCSYKVAFKENPGLDNATHNYFRTRAEAEAECNRRNAPRAKIVNVAGYDGLPGRVLC